jgi:hypothetical protein
LQFFPSSELFPGYSLLWTSSQLHSATFTNHLLSHNKTLTFAAVFSASCHPSWPMSEIVHYNASRRVTLCVGAALILATVVPVQVSADSSRGQGIDKGLEASGATGNTQSCEGLNKAASHIGGGFAICSSP